MYFRVQNENKMYDYADYKFANDCYYSDLCTQEEYQQSPNKYLIEDDEQEIEVIDYDEEGKPIGKHTEIIKSKKLVLNPDYEQEEAEKRELDFKADFFLIPSYGWFRKKPKGYSSAVESLNTAFNAVTIMQKLPANMLIFYQEPDFTKPEECTEEWLIEHQTFNEEMTAQEFGQFYVGFMTAWNNEEHK